MASLGNRMIIAGHPWTIDHVETLFEFNGRVHLTSGVTSILTGRPTVRIHLSTPDRPPLMLAQP